MKAKLCIILAFLCVSLSCLAQEGLLMDKPGKNGSRTIGTYYHYMTKGFTDTAPVGLSIIADITPDSTKYYLSARMSNVRFPKGGVFLIKTSLGEVLELTQLSEKYDTESIHYIPNVGVINQGIGLYPISIDQLNILNQDGISKVRIETTAEVIDREYKPKQVEKYMKEFSVMFNLVLKTLSQKKDIYSDF